MYEEPITRAKPACIVFLLDRSDSMGRDWGNRETLAEGTARVVNDILLELCIRGRKGPGVTYRYFDIGVFGYGIRPNVGGQGVESALGGRLNGMPLVPLPDLADNPLGLHEVASPDLGGLSVKIPYWIESAHGLMTPMCEAVAVAGQHVSDWVWAHPESFPPIIFNITDGWVTDSPYDGASLDDWAARLTALGTHDGHALLFNIFLSPNLGTPTIFPETSAGLPEPARSLFQISSVLPPTMIDYARNDGLAVAGQARGFAFNADASTLLKALKIGTGIGNIGTRVETMTDRERTHPMRMQQVIFSAPKHGYRPAEWEDGAAGATVRGESLARFAVADGVTEGYESRRWVSHLLDSFLPPWDQGTRAGPALDRDSLGRWLEGMQHDWALSIPPATDYIDQQKIKQGASATFVGCQLDGLDGRSSPRWQAAALGDAVLFHVRHGRLLKHLPTLSAADFGAARGVLSTRPEGLTAAIKRFQFGSGELAPGDLLFAATSTFAKWMLTWVEKDEETLWRALAALAHPDDFDLLIAEQRQAKAMADDDVTLLRVRLLTRAPDMLVVWRLGSIRRPAIASPCCGTRLRHSRRAGAAAGPSPSELAPGYSARSPGRWREATRAFGLMF